MHVPVEHARSQPEQSCEACEDDDEDGIGRKGNLRDRKQGWRKEENRASVSVSSAWSKNSGAESGKRLKAGASGLATHGWRENSQRYAKPPDLLQFQ
jgi:hypothetical protein